jgi:type II secretory pathway pseudopilin PulG
MFMLTAILTIMKKGGYRRAVAGFTIVETLIVLAVTAGILISALIAIGGRTNRTQFMTASNDLKQQLQQVINETTNGYFPNSSNFTCTKRANQSPALADGNQAQGTNGDCIFLGKAIQFGVHGNTGVFLAYAIAGNRLQQASNLEVSQLSQSYPVAVAPGTSSANNVDLDGITVSNALEGGLTVSKMSYVNSAGTTVQTNGFAVLTTLASYTAPSGCDGLCSGGQGITLYGIRDGSNTVLGSQNSASFVDSLDAANAASYDRASSISICFNSGSTNQSALYTIGDVGNEQSVTMKIQTGSC